MLNLGPPSPREKPKSGRLVRRFCGKCGAGWQEGAEKCELCGFDPTMLSGARTRGTESLRAELDGGGPRERSQAAQGGQLVPPRLPDPGEDHHPRVLGWTGAVALYLVFLGVVFVAASLGARGWNIVEAQVLVVALESLAIGLFALGGWRVLSQAIRSPVPPKWILAGVGLAGLSFPIARLTAETSREPVGGGPEVSWLAALSIIAVAPAILEELAFRGLILPSLAEHVGTWGAISASAVMFATLHLSLNRMPFLIVMGFLLGWLRVRSGSLLPPMAMHFVHNASAALLIRS
jgi:membrane protease YdiL (CAAX protease family)